MSFGRIGKYDVLITPVEEGPTSLYRIYVVRNKLGSGSHGTVYEAYRMMKTLEDTFLMSAETNDMVLWIYRQLQAGQWEQVAVKHMTVRQHSPQEREARQEITMLMELPSTPHLLRYIDVYQREPEAGSTEISYFIITEFVPGISMFKWTRDAERALSLYGHSLPNPALIFHMTEQFLSTVQLLHSHSIWHGDIKPENMIWNHDQRRLVLIDFGFSCKPEGQSVAAITPRTRRPCRNGRHGTYYFMAPEMILRSDNSIPFSMADAIAIDTYAVGMTLFSWLSLEWPFETDDMNGLETLEDFEDFHFNVAETHKDLKIIWPAAIQASAELAPWREMVQQLVRFQPADRWSLQRALSHLKGSQVRMNRGQSRTRTFSKRAVQSLSADHYMTPV